MLMSVPSVKAPAAATHSGSIRSESKERKMGWILVLLRDTCTIAGAGLVLWMVAWGVGLVSDTVRIDALYFSSMFLAWLKAELVDWPKELKR